MKDGKCILIALVENKPGVLNRVASLFRRRSFNIQSLTVGPTEQPHLSRMTIVVDGATTAVDQVAKQLYKVIEVVKVSDITQENNVTRELALVKVRTTPTTRSEILQLVDIFRSSIVDVSPDSLIIEVTGDQEKVDSLVQLLRPFGLKEVQRTGLVAIARGATTVTTAEEEMVPTHKTTPPEGRKERSQKQVIY